MKIILPKGACDTHMHFYDQGIPGAPGTFLPGHFPVEPYQAMQKQLGLERVVVVQPNAYADDNRVTLDAIKKMGIEKAKGVGVVKPGVKDAELELAKQCVERLVQDILRRSISYNYGDDARRFVPGVRFGETDSANQGALWTAVASLMSASYFTTDQLPQVDSMIGMPVRLPMDASDVAAQQTQQQTSQGDMPANRATPQSARQSIIQPSTGADGLRPQESPVAGAAAPSSTRRGMPSRASPRSATA